MSERREQRAAEQLQRISDRWTTMSGNGVAHTPARNDVIVPSAAEFREHGLSADSAAQVLAVHYRLGSCLAGAPGPLTSTGKADAAVRTARDGVRSPDSPLQSDAALAHPKVTAINIWALIKRVDGECWPWIGYVNKRGYGRFGGAKVLSHRAVWEMVNGPIPIGHVIRHTCDNKICCNPDHLLPGTHADNVADMCSRGRNAMGEKNGRRKLSEEDVRKIRSMYIPRVVTRKKLSGLFGITESMIEKIVRRVYWKHLA